MIWVKFHINNEDESFIYGYESKESKKKSSWKRMMMGWLLQSLVFRVAILMPSLSIPSMRKLGVATFSIKPLTRGVSTKQYVAALLMGMVIRVAMWVM
jgi:hypothetical protein